MKLSDAARNELFRVLDGFRPLGASRWRTRAMLERKGLIKWAPCGTRRMLTDAGFAAIGMPVEGARS